jgi:hypothetical protein
MRHTLYNYEKDLRTIGCICLVWLGTLSGEAPFGFGLSGLRWDGVTTMGNASRTKISRLTRCEGFLLVS